jgi:hypothetical protein
MVTVSNIKQDITNSDCDLEKGKKKRGNELSWTMRRNKEDMEVGMMGSLAQQKVSPNTTHLYQKGEWAPPFSRDMWLCHSPPQYAPHTEESTRAKFASLQKTIMYGSTKGKPGVLPVNMTHVMFNITNMRLMSHKFSSQRLTLLRQKTRTGIHILELVPRQGHTKTLGASPLSHSITWRPRI